MASRNCAVEDCSDQVNKKGHYLCYDHWRAWQQDGTVHKCEECGDWSETEEEICEDCSQEAAPKKMSADKSGSMLTATKLGAFFEISAQKTNLALAELGWMKKGKADVGWVPTKHGKKIGAVKRTASSGTPYVMWPEAVAVNRVLRRTIDSLFADQFEEWDEEEEFQEEVLQAAKSQTVEKDDFRSKFPPKYRTHDGHMVRSRGEAMIDNWLYQAHLVHVYERKLPIEEAVYCDFYVPLGEKAYIEYWGMEEQGVYRRRMERKQEIYAQYGFHLIDIHDKDLEQLDDRLPRLLLDFGIKTH